MCWFDSYGMYLAFAVPHMFKSSFNEIGIQNKFNLYKWCFMGIIEIVMLVWYLETCDNMLRYSIVIEKSLFSIIRSWTSFLWKKSPLGARWGHLYSMGDSLFLRLFSLTSFIICKIFSSVRIKCKTEMIIPICQ